MPSTLLERYAGTHYQYDKRGNRRRQTEPSGRTTEYRYDADDRLVEVKRYRRAPAAGNTTPPEMQAKYGYDGFGRRLWKLVKDGKATPVHTVFSWDANLLSSEEVFEGEFHFWDAFAYPKEPELTPEDPSQKFSLPLAQRVHSLTARALTRTHWLYEPDSFVPAAQLVEAYNHHAKRMTGTGHAAYSSTVSTGTSTAEPQLYYIHTDHLGTPQELTDRDGHLQWTGHYRALGELAKANDHSGQTARVEMPLRFQGQYCDAETGLHYNRHRYYDPQLGRFTTQDPISLAGGVNLYQYAPNPVQWIDPLGLANRPNNGKYNIFFDHSIDPSNRYSSDAVQFKKANDSLIKRMNSDAEFRRDMLGRHPELSDWMKNGSKSSSPSGFTWHHHEDVNRLVLVDRADHKSNHRLYHPTRKGGRDIWGGGKPGRHGKLDGATGERNCP